LESDGRVALRIADTGEGIAPEHLAHVFEPFFTTKAERGGSGLGLSICRMLVAAQGGDIAIESRVGRGTTVTVRLRPATPISP
jgi:two-component system, NtrC family, sensor kinase